MLRGRGDILGESDIVLGESRGVKVVVELEVVSRGYRIEGSVGRCSCARVLFGGW